MVVELKEETSRYFDGVVGNDEREKNYNDGGGGGGGDRAEGGDE